MRRPVLALSAAVLLLALNACDVPEISEVVEDPPAEVVPAQLSLSTLAEFRLAAGQPVLHVAAGDGPLLHALDARFLVLRILEAQPGVLEIRECLEVVDDETVRRLDVDEAERMLQSRERAWFELSPGPCGSDPLLRVVDLVLEDRARIAYVGLPLDLPVSVDPTLLFLSEDAVVRLARAVDGSLLLSGIGAGNLDAVCKRARAVR